MERKLAAILFTDVVGYTVLMARDEAAGRAVRARHESLVRDEVARYHGRWIEEKGDESLSIFPSVLDAVHCALAIQERLSSDPDLALRIGVHLGDVTIEGDRVFGDGVNVAARVRPLAEPGGVCVSQPVCDSIRNQPHLVVSALGARELKGVAAPMELFEVSGSPVAPGPVARRRRGPASRRSRIVALLAIAAVCLLGAAGWWILSAPSAARPSIRSIAVLPLDDPSNDSAQAYFAFGLTEALIAELAKVQDLRVISRTSVTPYENSTKSIPVIAQELGVQGVVEGSVIREGDRVRITVQLIDARSDMHLWAESYERDLADVLALQSDVAGAIARAIHLEVSGDRPAPRPVVPAAHEAYLKGYYFQMKRTREDTLRAVSYFREAIALDPASPLGHAGLADEYSCAPTHSWGIASSALWSSVPKEMLSRAREHAQKALELDPASSAGHNSMALVRTYADWDWEGAESAHRKTIEISPAREWARSTYGLFLAYMGRLDEALHQMETARALDPMRIDTIMWLASLHIWRGEPEQAMARWRESLEIDSAYPGLLQSVITTLCGTDAHGEALAAIERGMQTYPNDPLVTGELAYCHAVAGNRAGARSLLADMLAQADIMYVSPVSRAMVHVGLGETTAAFEALEEGFLDRDPQMLSLGLDPVWAPLKPDPRYRDLMQRIGLPMTPS